MVFPYVAWGEARTPTNRAYTSRSLAVRHEPQQNQIHLRRLAVRHEPQQNYGMDYVGFHKLNPTYNNSNITNLVGWAEE